MHLIFLGLELFLIWVFIEYEKYDKFPKMFDQCRVKLHFGDNMFLKFRFKSFLALKFMHVWAFDQVADEVA